MRTRFCVMVRYLPCADPRFLMNVNWLDASRNHVLHRTAVYANYLRWTTRIRSPPGPWGTPRKSRPGPGRGEPEGCYWGYTRRNRYPRSALTPDEKWRAGLGRHRRCVLPIDSFILIAFFPIALFIALFAAARGQAMAADSKPAAWVQSGARRQSSIKMLGAQGFFIWSFGDSVIHFP
jgi:hypothetical protein